MILDLFFVRFLKKIRRNLCKNANFPVRDLQSGFKD